MPHTAEGCNRKTPRGAGGSLVLGIEQQDSSSSDRELDLPVSFPRGIPYTLRRRSSVCALLRFPKAPPTGGVGVRGIVIGGWGSGEGDLAGGESTAARGQRR